MPTRLYFWPHIKNMISVSKYLMHQSSKYTATAGSAPLVQSIPSAAALAPRCTSNSSSRLPRNIARRVSSTHIATAASNSSLWLSTSRLPLQSTGVCRDLPASQHLLVKGNGVQQAVNGAARYLRSCTAAASSNSGRPSVGDLEAGMSSEAIGMDEAAIDAIPAESLPAGANRTQGPQPGVSPQPEVEPEAGDPQPDSVRPPSGPSGPDQAYEAGEPLAGKPRTSGPEVNDSRQEQKPEVQGPPGAVNPDRIPFWGS